MARPPLPPFTAETARAKVQGAEDAWNTRDPERVALAYTEDSLWRNRDRFVTGRAEIVEFLRQKWERELDYALRKEMWAYTGNRIAVRFQYESHDASGQWWRSYGNELWEFDEDGLMRRREASINDLAIDEWGTSHPRPAAGGRARHCLRSCLVVGCRAAICASLRPAGELGLPRQPASDEDCGHGHHLARFLWSSAVVRRGPPAGPVPHRGLPRALRRADPAGRPRRLGADRHDGDRRTCTRWDWAALQALPQDEPTVDLHCVTRWSKLATTWRGVSLDTLLADVETAADYVLISSYGGYTTNVPLEDLLDGKAWIAHEYDGEPLAAEHGGPARLLVPHLYLWKSAKWVRGLTLSLEDEPGFWETAGYHNYGDPWREQRYWGE